MGAEFNFKILDAKNDVDAKDEGHELIKQCKHEYGHGGYTGSFAECTGVKLLTETVPLGVAVDAWLD